MAESSNQIFLPWVQPGIASNIPDQATDKLDANQPSAVSLPLRLVINSEAVDKTLRLYGPGDVTGIDPQQIVRIEPRNLTTDFEPNYFPAIEFDRPDFPWLFTPAKADAQSRLRPWLSLVVVRKQQGVELRPAGNLPLPVLEIKSPARPVDELPDLSESHFWAHAQVTGSSKSNIKTTLESIPARSVSRLLCPRRLQPTTEYIACVVPSFEVGRKAGLNLPIQPEDGTKLEPAWKSGNEAPAEITLPVYYSWEFRTSEGGDFEELVRRLEPRALPAEVGKRPIDISQPGFVIEPQPQPDAPGTTLGLEGALRVVNTEPDEWPDEVRVPFQSALEKIVNIPWEIATKESTDEEPIVGPPVYGCWQAGVHLVSATTESSTPVAWPPPFWLDELNLDPRNRSIAAMGTRVIQDQQEELMASAWEQLGEIEKINQRLRQAQLSRAVNDKYYNRSFNRFSWESFVKVIAPSQSRVMVTERPSDQPASTPPVKRLLVQSLTSSFVPKTATSAPLRKLTRPRGAINRQYSKAGATGAQTMFAFFNTSDVVKRTGQVAQSKGAVTINQVSETFPSQAGFVFVRIPPPGHMERIKAIDVQINNTFRLSNLTGNTFSTRQPTPTTNPQFLEAAKAHQQFLTGAFMTMIFADFRRPINTNDMRLAALSSFSPAMAVSRAVYSSININSPSSVIGDELDPIMDAPNFPQPMYEALRDLSQDFLFPGLEHVPPNTVQLLQTNAKFIESFMVGLNAEMSRELLWRDYPTDQRGTYFRQFWDTESAGAEPQPDIAPINQWGKRALGTTAVGTGGDKLVLLIRGELLRRYPSTVIYAVKAVMKDGKRELSLNPADESYPIFRGTLDPDVTFIGFNLTPTDVMTEPGWYFVLQQQPTELRFGMDDDPFAEGESGVIPELKTWDDLNWAHLAPSAEELNSLSHVSVNKVQLTPTQPTKGVWGRNASHMAYITRQRLSRVAIHATELLPS